jgi:hypothetical protein
MSEVWAGRRKVAPDGQQPVDDQTALVDVSDRTKDFLRIRRQLQGDLPLLRDDHPIQQSRAGCFVPLCWSRSAPRGCWMSGRATAR